MSNIRIYCFFIYFLIYIISQINGDHNYKIIKIESGKKRILENDEEINKEIEDLLKDINPKEMIEKQYVDIENESKNIAEEIENIKKDTIKQVSKINRNYRNSIFVKRKVMHNDELQTIYDPVAKTLYKPLYRLHKKVVPGRSNTKKYQPKLEVNYQFNDFLNQNDNYNKIKDTLTSNYKHIKYIDLIDKINTENQELRDEIQRVNIDHNNYNDKYPIHSDMFKKINQELANVKILENFDNRRFNKVTEKRILDKIVNQPLNKESASKVGSKQLSFKKAVNDVVNLLRLNKTKLNHIPGNEFKTKNNVNIWTKDFKEKNNKADKLLNDKDYTAFNKLPANPIDFRPYTNDKVVRKFNSQNKNSLKKLLKANESLTAPYSFRSGRKNDNPFTYEFNKDSSSKEVEVYIKKSLPKYSLWNWWTVIQCIHFFAHHHHY